MERFKTGEFVYKDGRVLRKLRRVNGSTILKLSEYEDASYYTTRGYLRISITINKKTKQIAVHRLIYAYHYGIDELISHEVIDHVNGIKDDNRIENLEGVTIRENTRRAEANGLYKRTYGEINGMTKLSDIQIKAIRKLAKSSTMTQYELAELFDVSQSHISNIINNKKRLKRSRLYD